MLWPRRPRHRARRRPASTGRRAWRARFACACPVRAPHSTYSLIRHCISLRLRGAPCVARPAAFDARAPRCASRDRVRTRMVSRMVGRARSTYAYLECARRRFPDRAPRSRRLGHAADTPAEKSSALLYDIVHVRWRSRARARIRICISRMGAHSTYAFPVWGRPWPHAHACTPRCVCT